MFGVSGSGTAILSGTAKNRGLFLRVIKLANATGTRIAVSNATSDSMQIAAPSEDGDATPSVAGSPSTRGWLVELRSLKEDGLNSETEYEAKRQAIIDAM